MQSIDSSKNYLNDISLYYKILNNDVFKNQNFISLMNFIIKEENHKNTIGIYTDTNLLSINIFLPIFHTMYLGCQNHKVIINDENDLWLIDTFKNNQYYVFKNDDKDFDYSPYNITEIDNIKDII